MQQCITWDGTTLACLDLRHPGETETVLYNVNQPMPRVSFPRSTFGVVQALILHAENPSVMTAVKDLLETLPLDEFMRFYYRAARQGLLGKQFSFMMMAVLEKTVLAMDVHPARRMQMFHYVAREETIALGEHAVAAMLLMDTGIPAQTACGVGTLELFPESGAHYDTCQYMTWCSSEVPRRAVWEYRRDDQSRSSFHALPWRAKPLMHNFYTRLDRGESVL